MQETHLSARPEFDPWAGKIPAEGNDHCSFVENRMDRGAWRATVHRVARVRHDDSATTVLLINSHVLLLLMLLPTLPFRIDHAAHTNTQGVAQTLLPLSPLTPLQPRGPPRWTTQVSALLLPRDFAPQSWGPGCPFPGERLPPSGPPGLFTTCTSHRGCRDQNSQGDTCGSRCTLPTLPISAALIRTWEAALLPVFLSVSSTRVQAS